MDKQNQVFLHGTHFIIHQLLCCGICYNNTVNIVVLVVNFVHHHFQYFLSDIDADYWDVFTRQKSDG